MLLVESRGGRRLYGGVKISTGAGTDSGLHHLCTWGLNTVPCSAQVRIVLVKVGKKVKWKAKNEVHLLTDGFAIDKRRRNKGNDSFVA